jgi:TATA-box binding protein (TBP) (component of TFIID and TFIIIB)
MRMNSITIDSHVKASLERRLAHTGARHHVSTMTFIARWSRAPPNLQTLMETDSGHFTRSRFCPTAWEYRVPESTTRCRVYPTHKVLITGCRSHEHCIDALESLSTCLGGMEFQSPECHLININISLPWTLNSATTVCLQATQQVLMIEHQERRPATIVHIDTGDTIKKVLLYQRTGKLSMHVASWTEADTIWTLLSPVLHACEGFRKQSES